MIHFNAQSSKNYSFESLQKRSYRSNVIDILLVESDTIWMLELLGTCKEIDPDKDSIIKKKTEGEEDDQGEDQEEEEKSQEEKPKENKARQEIKQVYERIRYMLCSVLKV